MGKNRILTPGLKTLSTYLKAPFFFKKKKAAGKKENIAKFRMAFLTHFTLSYLRLFPALAQR